MPARRKIFTREDPIDIEAYYRYVKPLEKDRLLSPQPHEEQLLAGIESGQFSGYDDTAYSLHLTYPAVVRLIAEMRRRIRFAKKYHREEETPSE
jgi:hypothetical protein